MRPFCLRRGPVCRRLRRRGRSRGLLVFFRGAGGVECLCDGFASVDCCAFGVEALCEVIYEFVHIVLLLFVLVVEWIIF